MSHYAKFAPFCAAFVLGGLTLVASAQNAPQRIHLKPSDLPKPYHTPSANNAGVIVAKPEGATLKTPAGFHAEVFAGEFARPRSIAAAPNGDLFVAEAGADRITLVRPGADGKPAKRVAFLEQVMRPFGMIFWKNWLYIGTPNAVLRVAYKPGQTAAEGEPEVVVPNLPVGGHWTRSLAFNPKNNKMYVSIGSSMDIGEEKDPRRATLCEFNPDGTGFRIFATGLRNIVGLACHPKTGAVWASVQERDGLGDDLVPDYVTNVRAGGFYGWPWYYIGANLDPRMKENADVKYKTLLPDVLLTSHTAAMCMVFYTGKQFPKQYQGDAFLALHGSGNRAKRVGYSIVRIPFRNDQPAGGYEDFVTGWMLGEDDPTVWGRPVGMAQGADGSLFMADDGANCIWRIYYKK